jgi:UDP-glucose 4-epimerase
MAIKHKHILVTGGAGYIGSHTVVELINQGFNVSIIDNLNNSSIEVIDSIETITGVKPRFYNFDLCDELLTSKFIFENDDIDAAIHFAAYKAVGESVEQPLKYYKNNLGSLVSLLDGISKSKPKNFKGLVFSSSCTVYGQPDKLPVTENSEIKKAESPYGHTKQISEDILINNARNVDYSSIALRYFNPIGAHESALIGELPNGVPNNLVPYITQTGIGKRECLNVFGNDYDTADGSCIRDFIHVVDLAKAHVAAINRLLEDKTKNNFEVFNIGTGKGNSVLEVINSFEKVSDKRLNYKIVERRLGDIEKIYADTTIANEELNWHAESSLDEAMLSAWKWELYLKSIGK